MVRIPYWASEGIFTDITKQIDGLDNKSDLQQGHIEAGTVDGKEYLVHPGEVLVMPANVPHAVSAPEAFKWVLTVVFPEGFKK